MNSAIVAANILQKHGLSGGAGGGSVEPSDVLFADDGITALFADDDITFLTQDT